MEIKEIAISKLKPAKYNPRKDLQPDDPEYIKLKRSMEEFGDVDPIIWNEDTGNIVGGHQRFKIYQEMGHKKLKVSVVNLTEKAEAVLNVALNKISGDWDYPKLKDLISEIDTGEFDIDLTGFDQEDLDKMFGIVCDLTEKETDDNIIFKEFGRVKDIEIIKIQGAGLGLALTKKLVDLHSGKIWYESEYGKGTKFSFTIPKRGNE